jgi:hypothetical protein
VIHKIAFVARENIGGPRCSWPKTEFYHTATRPRRAISCLVRRSASAVHRRISSIPNHARSRGSVAVVEQNFADFCQAALALRRSDEFGYRGAVDRVSVHDLHAVFHLVGFDH